MSLQNSKDRFLSDLGMHSPGQDVHYTIGLFSRQYSIPMQHVPELLVKWSQEGLIRLRAYDGNALRRWTEWPDLNAFFYNRSDGGPVRIPLLADGWDYVEILKKTKIGFIQSA